MQIGKGREGWYIGIAVGILAIASFFIIQGAIKSGVNLQTFKDTGRDLAPWFIIAFGTSFLLVEGIDMLAEQFRRRRFQEGREEGLQEGLQEGRREANREWTDWNERRERAQREDRSFNEPPPSEKQA